MIAWARAEAGRAAGRMLLLASLLAVRGPAAACADAAWPAPVSSEHAGSKPRDFGTATPALITVAPEEKPPAGLGARSSPGKRSGGR